MELAEHYEIASPRLFNVARGTIPAGKSLKQRRKPHPIPAYMDSYYDERKSRPPLA